MQIFGGGTRVAVGRSWLEIGRKEEEKWENSSLAPKETKKAIFVLGSRRQYEKTRNAFLGGEDRRIYRSSLVESQAKACRQIWKMPTTLLFPLSLLIFPYLGNALNPAAGG